MNDAVELPTRNRITEEHVDACIYRKEFYVFHGSKVTVCCLTLQNGFKVLGSSACVDPKNFNKEKGEEIAFNKARAKIYDLEGYILQEQMYQDQFAGRLQAN